MTRANYIPAPHFFELNQACCVLTEAFGYHVYLVGSAIERRILPDDEYARLFGDASAPTYNALWSLMCSAISLWLSRVTGLPVDFQIQQQTAANKDPGRPRHALGIFLRHKPLESAGRTADDAPPYGGNGTMNMNRSRVLVGGILAAVAVCLAVGPAALLSGDGRAELRENHSDWHWSGENCDRPGVYGQYSDRGHRYAGEAFDRRVRRQFPPSINNHHFEYLRPLDDAGTSGSASAQ